MTHSESHSLTFNGVAFVQTVFEWWIKDVYCQTKSCFFRMKGRNKFDSPYLFWKNKITGHLGGKAKRLSMWAK
jgi:hypothetical protein